MKKPRQKGSVRQCVIRRSVWHRTGRIDGLHSNQRRPDGFALVLVITAMAIIGLEMHVLTSGANTMLFQADTAYLEACKRNLITSGLAWAKRNIRNNNRETFEKAVELDVSKMNPVRKLHSIQRRPDGIRGSSLIVTISIATDKEPQAQIPAPVVTSPQVAQVQVNVSCSRGRRTFRYDDKHKIRL